MKHRRPEFRKYVALVGAILFMTAGCGRQGAGSTASAAATPPAPASPFEHLNDGPRAAAAGPADMARVELGEKLFKSKGCTACHAFGHRGTGPDLDGVSSRRTAAWIQSQILHPLEMVKGDSTAHSLFAAYAVQMPNLSLSPEEARSLLEFVKEQDQKRGMSH